jgi:hypothetical protein
MSSAKLTIVATSSEGNRAAVLRPDLTDKFEARQFCDGSTPDSRQEVRNLSLAFRTIQRGVKTSTDLIGTVEDDPHRVGSLKESEQIADARSQGVSSFSDLPRVLEAGQRVIVRESDGRVSRGKVVLADEHRLDIQWRRWLFARRERSFTAATVESIKVKDSDWNGMLVGAGAGLVAGWLVDLQCCRDFSIAPLWER